MTFTDCIHNNKSILMEGALGERLKREFDLVPDEYVALASMIYNPKGADALKYLWEQYIEIARTYHLPLLVTTPTRRANKERIYESGYTNEIIKDNVQFLKDIQSTSNIAMYVGGLVGCKGDAYTTNGALTEAKAIEFHEWQIQQFVQANVDYIFAAIMPSLPEATGMAKVIAATKIPYIISFTIQKDGRLIDGTTIYDAIRTIDNAVENKPICYMANCVHPQIVYEALNQPFNKNPLVTERFLGIQANTSPLSYAELDNSIDLKTSDAHDLALDMIRLRELIPMKIFGGCCGTDNHHMTEIAKQIIDLKIRKMCPEEYPLLNEFLYEAIFIPEGIEPPDRSILNTADLQVYVKDFGSESDDLCYVAQIGERIVGAVWVRIMNDYGHISVTTPSFAISLYKEYRGLGIGTQLMNTMIIELKQRGYKQASLAVQKENYAVHMYQHVGFKIVDENEEEYIMAIQL